MPLPIELIRDIVEEAAKSSRATALTLLAVSSNTKHWIEPILFHTVLVRTTDQLFLLKNCIGTERTKHCAPYVRRLWVTLKGSAADGGEHIVTALCGLVNQICPCLEYLAFEDPISPLVRSAYSSALEGQVKFASIFWLSINRALGPFQFPIHRISHLHVICPGPGFYKELGRCDERSPSNLESLVINITGSTPNTIGSGIKTASALIVRVLESHSSLQSIMEFLVKAKNLKEMIFKLQVSHSMCSRLTVALSPIARDPRVKVVQLPVDKGMQLPISTASDLELSRLPARSPNDEEKLLKKSLYDRVYHSFDDIFEHWPNA